MMMNKLTAHLTFALLLLTQQAGACPGHFYLGFDQSGLGDRATIKMPGQPSPAPAFKLTHPPMIKVNPGEEREVIVEYKRPKLSEDATITLTSTSGIQLHEKSIALEDYEGSFKVRYSLNKGNYNSINLKVSGTHKGETVYRNSVIYVYKKAKSR